MKSGVEGSQMGLNPTLLVLGKTLLVHINNPPVSPVVSQWPKEPVCGLMVTVLTGFYPYKIISIIHSFIQQVLSKWLICTR